MFCKYTIYGIKNKVTENGERMKIRKEGCKSQKPKRIKKSILKIQFYYFYSPFKFKTTLFHMVL